MGLCPGRLERGSAACARACWILPLRPVHRLTCAWGHHCRTSKKLGVKLQPRSGHGCELLHVTGTTGPGNRAGWLCSCRRAAGILASAMTLQTTPQPLTATRYVAYRRLALSILGADVRTLIAELR